MRKLFNILSPLMIATLFFFGVGIWHAINSGPEGWGLLVTIFCIPFAMFLLFVDVISRQIFKRRESYFIFQTLMFLLVVIAVFYFVS